MAFALIGSGVTASSTVIATTAESDPYDTTGADLIVVAASQWNSGGGAPFTTVFDNKSNTWTSLTLWGPDNATARIWYATTFVSSLTVGSGHVFTVEYNGTGIFPNVNVLAFSGVKTSGNPFDQESGAGNASASSQTPGSLTPSENNCLVISGATWNPDNFSAVSQLTIQQFNDPIAFRIGGGIAYEIQTTATARNPSWSWSGASNEAVAMAVFKAAAGGASAGGPLIDGGALVRGSLRGRIIA